MDTITIELTRDEYDVLVDALRIAEDETRQALTSSSRRQIERLRQKLLEAWLAASMFDLDV